MAEKKFTKKILFIGMPDMALFCLNILAAENINIAGVVPPQKNDSTYNLMVNMVKNLGLNLIDYNNDLDEEDFLQKVKNLNADLGVVASYNKKLPKALLELTKDGFINIHPSMLPDYRGANPYSHVIINGEKYSAITLHFMDEQFDTGDIISQYRFKLNEDETMGTLFARTNQMSALMLFEALEYYENNELPRKPQPVCENYKKAPALSYNKKNTFIDWSKSAEETERFIRGLNPFIGAVTCYKGTVLRVNSATVIRKKHKFTAGEICDTKNSLKVACGKDILELNSIQYGALFISTGSDFVKRIKPKKGEILKSE